jgi:hypothetical protein
MRLTAWTRTGFAVLATAGLATGIGIALTRHDAPLIGALPVAIAVWSLFVVHHGYLVTRALRWRRRQRTERQRLAELAIPADVPKPGLFDGVAAIDAAQHALLPRIPDYQGAMYARGVKVALLPSLAVLVAALQATLSQPSAAVAIGLASAELAVMLLLIALVWRSPNPADQWVRARTRAELLRREQYLRLAAVGPYQSLDALDADRRTADRISQLTSTVDTELRRHIALTSPAGVRWIDQLWTGPGPGPRPSAVAERLRSYLYYRVGKQLLWFELGTESNQRAERQIAMAIKAALVAAVAAIGVQTLLQTGHGPSGTPVQSTATVLTLALPPVCAFLLAVQELYSYRRLGLSYGQTLDDLRQAQTELTELLAGPDNDERARRFQAVVLHTETALTDELRRWVMLTQRDEFDLAL